MKKNLLNIITIIFLSFHFSSFILAEKEGVMFTPPERWTRIPPPSDRGDVYAFVTSREPGELLAVLIRIFNISNQTALEWAIDEAKSIEAKGYKIVAQPKEITIGNNSWVKLESEIYVQGKKGVLEGTTKSEQYFTKLANNSMVEISIMGKEKNFNKVNNEEITELLSSFKSHETYNNEPEERITQLSEAEELAMEGSRCFEARDFDKAIELLEKSLMKNPSLELKGAILFSLSSSYLEKGIEPYLFNKDDSFYKKSIDYAKKCLEIQPHYWQALANMGTVYMNMDDLEKADYYFKEAKKYVDVNSPYYQQLDVHHMLVIKKLEAIRNKSK